MNFKKLLGLFLWAYAGYCSAHNIVRIDTVELARKLSYEKQYTQSVALLQQFESNHPDDINSVRLHGQILYWEKDFEGAFLLFHAALKRNPNPYVQLDYGRMLFELYHLEEARLLLEDFIKTDPRNVEALNTLGTIAYWEGHTVLAKRYFASVSQQYPNNDWVTKYVGEIAEAQKPYIAISSTYNNDSQPLNSIGLNLETGWYRSYLLAPTFDIKTSNFTVDGKQNQVYQFYAANKFYFSAAKLKVDIGAGIYQNTGYNQTGWSGSLLLNEKISNQFAFDLYGGRQPYFSTVSSFREPVTLYNYGADVLIGKAESWSGWAGFSQQKYMDNNAIRLFGANILSPPVKAAGITLHIGYAFSYSNADNDLYIPSVTAAQVLQTNTFNGVYISYFTPKNQIENAILANILYQPIARLSASVNGRVGVYTTADKPYFYLNSSSDNQTIIQKGFYTQKFVPVQVNAAIKYQVSKKASLQAGYAYMNTFFYNSNIATLGLNLKI